ncbi:response regulator aspartate phosphatase [Bacillus cereus group sp. TH152-1LC]|uniref:response regulator aspartate phosphatase n=1 Tax=Bacillus cereus group sp. TH152-1LC TaxID=3018060 RepID=UPI0022DF55F9|nr:tetratricopeptide repeat protein [Bacillus cereus group sp. TH152-1LC]MDA1675326.1 tetratricopeptide repeat protein [Bacillus cereus group sp. TH152-1LC]
MDVQMKGNEKLASLLENWHTEIRKRNIHNAKQLKNEVDKKMEDVANEENILLYYSLLKFRHQYLVDNLGVGKDSFDEIESFEITTDETLLYYYHFFKAIHANIIGNYKAAKEYYDKAESGLKHIPDQLEHAEFYFKLSTFSCHNQQYVEVLKQVSKAKEVYSKYNGYEVNIGYCQNVYGLACIHLREFELAEENLISAMDIFQKHNEEQAILYVRHNLGFMYANQNLSELAIRYLSEVIEKQPRNYRAMFIEACEYEKLGKNDIALLLIEEGLKVSTELKNEEYQHHFKILKGLTQEIPGSELEIIVKAGIEYFEKERLYEYVIEYAEKLALRFYHEENSFKASSYFYLGVQASKQNHALGALK